MPKQVPRAGAEEMNGKETFQTFKKAEEEAQKFFKENFGYTSGVSIEYAYKNRLEFYSLDDPGMIDTFVCTIDDGRDYFCINGGIVKTQKSKTWVPAPEISPQGRGNGNG